MKILFLDLETTGDGSHPDHAILQIGCEIWEHLPNNSPKVLAKWCRNIRPNKSMSFQLKDNAYLAGSTRAFKHMKDTTIQVEAEVFKQFLVFIEKYVTAKDWTNRLVVVAHNANHEKRNIWNLFTKYKKNASHYMHFPFVCTQQLGILGIQKSQSLSDLARSLSVNIQTKSLHDAAYDAMICRQIYFKLVELLVKTHTQTTEENGSKRK